MRNIQICQRCKQEKPVGPWKSGTYTLLCGRCKLEITLTPSKIKALEEDIRQFLTTDIKERKSVV